MLQIACKSAKKLTFIACKSAKKLTFSSQLVEEPGYGLPPCRLLFLCLFLHLGRAPRHQFSYVGRRRRRWQTCWQRCRERLPIPVGCRYPFGCLIGLIPIDAGGAAQLPIRPLHARRGHVCKGLWVCRSNLVNWGFITLQYHKVGKS